MEFKDCLRMIRKRNKMTQGELAGLLQCSQSSVSAWEKGACAPNIEQVRVLYRVLSVSLEDLFGEKEHHRRPRSLRERKQSLISLERLRRGHEMSRAQLAELLHISEKTVANWERNGIPHLTEIKKIVNIFQVNINELL